MSTQQRFASYIAVALAAAALGSSAELRAVLLFWTVVALIVLFSWEGDS